MKKIYFVLIVLVFVFHSGVALASVSSDSLAVQYQACIAELAKVETLHYAIPDPNDPIFKSGSMSSATYEQVLNAQKNGLQHQEDVRQKCAALESQISPATTSSVHRDINPTENTPGTVLTVDDNAQYNDRITTLENQAVSIQDQLDRNNILLGTGAVFILFLVIAVASLLFRKQ